MVATNRELNKCKWNERNKWIFYEAFQKDVQMMYMHEEPIYEYGVYVRYDVWLIDWLIVVVDV